MLSISCILSIHKLLRLLINLVDCGLYHARGDQMSLFVKPLLVLGKHFVGSTLPSFDTLVNIYALLQLLVIARNVDAHILKHVL